MARVRNANRRVVYLASTKLSNYQITKIIRAFAFEVPASDAARKMNVSYLTVRTVYGLLRRRMVELRVYTAQSEYEHFMEQGEGDEHPYWDRTSYDEFVTSGLRKRKGVTDATKADHIAELTYRYERPSHLSLEQFRQRHFAEIIQAIRLSGPINRPVTERGLLLALEYRSERLLSLGRVIMQRALTEAQRDVERLSKLRAASTSRPKKTKR